jgi:hypothetical protein
MNPSLRLPYQERDPATPSGSQMPYLPLLLSSGSQQVAAVGLLDTGATVNVLPYPLGLHLGLVWDQQRTPLRLSGNLAQAPARAVVIHASIASFSVVRLAFAWTQLASVPVILGQVNFFLEFDVCFFASQAVFEITPKQNR